MTGPTAESSASARPYRRMHLNESPYPPPRHIVEAITSAASGINRYPHAEDEELLAALAGYCGAPQDRIVVTSGSNELLHLLPLIADAAGHEMVIANPSFPTYQKAAGFYGITVHAVPVDNDGKPDIGGILAAITPKCRLVCVPSPNNPTGGLLDGDEITRLVQGIGDDVLLHFDEAYYEFGKQAGGVDTLPILETRKGPWLASRSFSKAFGIAGARLGYSIAGEPALAARCRSLRPNFSVNALAQAAGLAALKNSGHMTSEVATIAAERQRIHDGLFSLGLSPLPSAANFVAFPDPVPGTGVAPLLKETGILVGAFRLPGERAAIRISVAAGEDTDALLAALAKILVP